MSGDTEPHCCPLPRWLVGALLLGLYLSFRGYHSFDGDQAYRLPLLLHWQNPHIFADDPFVKAFDSFNPHRGWLMVLDLATRPLGLAAGLFLVFVVTFGATCGAIDRLARGVWPGLGAGAGVVAIGLVLAAKAGNIGTNHIFEAMVLDRQLAFAMGWLAVAQQVVLPERGRLLVMAAIGAATLVHPSAGLQLALVLAASWAGWYVLAHWTKVNVRDLGLAYLSLALAVIPGLALNLGTGSRLMGEMPAHDFWLLSVELQSPQHMLPHLWRMPQWLACGSYLALAALAMGNKKLEPPIKRDDAKQATSSALGWPPARVRLVVLLAVIVAGLGVAWYAIERLHAVRVTVFQPFRMATLARGIALILLSGRVISLWRTSHWLSRLRAILIAVAVTGDWLMVVVTAAELAVATAEAIKARVIRHPGGVVFDATVLFGVLALGLNFLGHHDTEYGHLPLLGAIGTGMLAGVARFFRSSSGRSTRFKLTDPWWRRTALATAWALPLAALLAAVIPADWAIARSSIVRGLISRCRFVAVPADDIERLAIWCRSHTPASARFIGPPGPKTFRLWSQRNLAFNRSASPYHAAGLADWFGRFQDHVGFHGRTEAFVQGYVADRHGFEARYDRLSDCERAALALRQGAEYVIAPARAQSNRDAATPQAVDPLELLHVEGRFAVYRVRFGQLVQRQR